MLGYCSNSPLRCTNARSTAILNQTDPYCPECRSFLLPAQDISQQLYSDEQFLRVVVVAAILMLLILVYIYYLIFE